MRNSQGSWAERLLAGGIFLLPLVCLPGLEHPFSAPKTWLLAGLDLGLAVHYLWWKSKARPTPQAGDWPWTVWLAAVALSALIAPYVSLEALLLTLLPVPLCWAVRQGQLPVDRVKRAILWGSAIESAIVVLQYAQLDPLGWLGWQPEAFGSARMRVYGTLGNPDFVAAWLCATLPLYAGVRRRGYAALGLQLVAILATGSRVFLLTLPVGAGVLAVRGIRLRKWWLAALAAAAALLFFSPARPLGVTVEGRLYLARVAASHWRQIPLTGYGPGSFGMQFAQWQVEWLRQYGRLENAGRFAGELDHAHNDYLEIWVEYGPVGLCAFLGLCGWLIWKAWRPDSPNAGVWSAVACLLAIACVDFPFHRPAEWGLYWLLLGMLAAPGFGRPAVGLTEQTRRIAE